MGNFIKSFIALWLTILITFLIVGLVIGFACLYYGAILFVLLSILKYFGVITVMAVL